VGWQKLDFIGDAIRVGQTVPDRKLTDTRPLLGAIMKKGNDIVPISTGVRQRMVKEIMQRLAKFSSILVLVQLMLVLAVVAPAFAAGAGYVSGSVFVDANLNTMAEPGEANVPNATVHLRSEADAMVEFTVLTDADGYYVLQNIPYGVYQLWADGVTLTAVATATIEIGEVNATVATNLPVYENSADIELTNIAQMYLPLILQ
jgi:hypothetical protein